MLPERLEKSSEEVANSDTIRLLLVDDDPGYRELCVRQLSRPDNQKFVIDTASNSSDAFERCKANNYDCLLVDYQLPDGSGTDIVDRLQEYIETLGPNCQLAPPTIIVTAEGGQHAPTQAIRAGAVDFMSKRNVTTDSLRRAIMNAVDKSRLQQSVLQRGIALEQAYSQLESANKQLESKRRELLTFYHTVSHEVKTPLAAAREFISLVRDGAAGELVDSQRELLCFAMDSCDQIRSQFTELLELARIDSGKLKLKRQNTPLDTIVRRSTASIAESAKTKQVTVIVDDYDASWHVYGDIDRIVQIVSNLLTNAVRFTPEQGTVTLSATQAENGEGMSIAVSDTGCGIEKKHLELIFERLYQVENLNHHSTGLGLGLSICRELLALHGSELKVSSSPGKGSCFHFLLAPQTPENQ